MSEVIAKSTSPTADGELVHDSEEYESAEEIEEEEYEEEVEEIEVEVEEDEDEEQAKDDEDEKEKQLDDDEDRKNPQFIPKKGYFYEHDDRMTGAPDPEEEEAPPKEERPRKDSSATPKTAKVISDRWSHDLYDENEQTPKSPSELQERYGYDIRTDDMAPRARRKRIYGRGPTKYTRNWEEEEAYHRPRGGFRGRGQRGREGRQPARRGSKGYDEDFPQLAEEAKGPEEKIVEGSTTAKATATEVSSSKIQDRPRGGKRSEERKSEDRDRNFDQRSGRGRGGRRNEFTNRNRFVDRSGGGGPVTGNNNSSNNRVKSRGEREWEQKVDKMREQDKQKSNGTRGNNSVDRDTNKNVAGGEKSSSPPAAPPPKKTTLPFTNTEYTGSASLTAHRNQDPTLNEPGIGNENDRNNISIKVINAGPEQGNREVRISESNRSSSGTQGQGSGMDRRSQYPSSRPQLQQQSVEATKPKRFSSQRTKQDTPLNATQVSASPPPRGVEARGSPQPLGVQQIPGIPVISGYPTPISQTYYDHVPVSIPTNYDGQVYENSGSPITVPITAHGQSVSPSLWTSQHAAYSTSPYPSPPTGPPVQAAYDQSYISAPQPQIFAPPPHPHPQFISDPTIINYVPPAPPQTYGTPFHPQGYQGYQNPGPELYHGGVTYYSPQTQMQRPHLMGPTKRPKSVLQLVEPSKRDVRQGPRSHLPPQEEALIMNDMYIHQYREESLPHVVDYKNTVTTTTGSDFTNQSMTNIKSTAEQLADKLEKSVRLQTTTEKLKKSPSPAPLDPPEPTSWADTMGDLTPLSSPSEQSSRKNSDFQGIGSGEKFTGEFSQGSLKPE